MDKNIIRQHLKNTFLSEATTPSEKLGSQIKSKNSKANKEGINAIAKEMSKYEKGLTKPDANAKTMAQNKFNYADDAEKEYHEDMEIMNGLEMNKYDRTPDDTFKERALEAIEGSSRMGNNPEWANVVVKGQGGDPEFGKNLVKRIKDSEKKRNKQTPTTKMFGNDWEVVKDEGHKAYAFEGENPKQTINENNPLIGKKVVVNSGRFHNEMGTIIDLPTGLNAVKVLLDNGEKVIVTRTDFEFVNNNQTDIAGDDFEKLDRQSQYGINPYNENTNKKTPQIKESMKRLKFKKEFNGVGNAIKMIPENYKVDKKVFEMTDGNESYKIRWEGSLNEGKAVVLMASDKKLVNEDIQKMKHLMGYKSQDTLGLVKGKDRITENSTFSDIFKKTKALLEMEDIEGQEAEKEAEFDQADISHAPEAKKHIQGSVPTDKKTEAPKPKEGFWDKISVPHASDAKKHVQGSVSADKGTKAPKPKTGDVEDAVSHAPEAKKHVADKKTSIKTTAKTGDWDNAKKA